MTRVVRLSDETIQLLERYKKLLKTDFTSQKYEMLSDILEKDNIVIQTALRNAIDFYY